MMANPSLGKTSITATCSPEFKERVQAYMERHNMTQTDVIIEAVSELLKFDSFVQATEHTAAADDWATMAHELGHEGRR